MIELKHADVIFGKKSICTSMGIGAHQDDLEIMAAHGIITAYKNGSEGFVGVVTADGAGSPRAGEYADISDAQMAVLRKEEQKEAALLGEYSCLAMLNYSSREIKDPAEKSVEEDYYRLLMHFKPKIVYIHNLCDAHPTHVATAVKAIAAMRRMERDLRPSAVYGMEVWRDLDWLPADEKVIFDLSAHRELQLDLIRVFRTQIAGGKAYDSGLMGRRQANATFGASHSVDSYALCSYGMDLTPLIGDESIGLAQFVAQKIRKFENEVIKVLS
jgi:LmbE family N-acetylglucosaminyl deacetylase